MTSDVRSEIVAAVLLRLDIVQQELGMAVRCLPADSDTALRAEIAHVAANVEKLRRVLTKDLSP